MMVEKWMPLGSRGLALQAGEGLRRAGEHLRRASEDILPAVVPVPVRRAWGTASAYSLASAAK